MKKITNLEELNAYMEKNGKNLREAVRESHYRGLIWA